MRIGFCGIGGTGKTTTLYAVQGHIKDRHLPVLKSVARGVMDKLQITEKDQIFKDEKKALELQEGIFEERMRVEKVLSQSGSPGFISDRTLFDTFCYMSMWCHRSLSPEKYETYKYLALENLKTYDRIYFFPSWAFRKNANEGVRAGDQPQADIMESLYEYHLQLHNGGSSVYRVEIVHMSDLERRAECISAKIKAIWGQ